MSYDLGQAVHISGLRFVPNDDTVTGTLYADDKPSRELVKNTLENGKLDMILSC